MAVAVIEAVSPSTPSDVSAGASDGALALLDRADSAGEVTPPPAPLEPEALVAQATAELRALLESTSSRIQRQAAIALARLGDEDAISRLRALLAAETVDLLRVEIAYALARAGDEAGERELAGALGARLRDVRMDAARSLVQLGDDRGVRQLRQMLSVRSHRIGAAGLMARAGNDEGLEVLRREVGDRNAPEENRMRAAVALGRAGDASVRDELVRILEDGRYQVGAADALAALGDHAAVPALVAQLDEPSMRVRAALGLRRLGAKVELEPLVAALGSGHEVGRVSAAEAILILAGPAHLAERD
jgi:HEAT repeat protein